jgi:hypothetical protein
MPKELWHALIKAGNGNYTVTALHLTPSQAIWFVS